MYEFHIYVHMWMHVHAEDGIGSPEAGDTVDCAPPYVCWEPNMSSLEQEVL